MRTIYFLLFPLFLFFIVSCTEDEVDPNFSIENVGDVVMGSAKGSQVTISFTSTREWKASTVADWFTIAPVSGEAGTCNIDLWFFGYWHLADTGDKDSCILFLHA